MINMIINCETGEVTNVETPDEIVEETTE